MTHEVTPCPLCNTADTSHFHRDNRREYLHCPTCKLVFVPRRWFISAEAEKAEYDRHRNDPEDPGYRRFLSRLAVPMQDRLVAHSHGLDFGAGPGPTLSVMFEEIGHKVAIYDPFYANDAALLETQYDFITATEVVEHLHKPGEVLDGLWILLKPGGWLGVMTKRVKDYAAFARWHYIRDPTHVCFFSRSTFDWLAARWRARIEFVDSDVVLFQKND